MAIDILENSEADAFPVFLFEFQLGLQVYGYTTCDEPIEKDGLTFIPDEAITSDNIEASAEDKGSPLKLKTDANFEIAKLYFENTPDSPMKLTVFLGNYGDTEYRVLWKGKVNGVSRIENHKAEIRCEQNLSIVERGGLTYRFGAGCQHTLYRGGCQLSFEAIAVDAVITQVDGAVLTSVTFGSLPINDLKGGLAQFNGSTYRMIVKHEANTITLSRPIKNIQAGDTLRVGSGCDRSESRCKALGNFTNHLSFNTIPSRNLFNGLSSKSNSDNRGNSGVTWSMINRILNK